MEVYVFNRKGSLCGDWERKKEGLGRVWGIDFDEIRRELVGGVVRGEDVMGIVVERRGGGW